MSNLIDHAKTELRLAGYYEDGEDDMNTHMRENILELVEVFSKQGHSGMSAPFCLQLFSRLAKYDPLSPLTGEDDEWNDVSEMWGSTHFQNKRFSAVFKDKEGRAYHTGAIVFEDKDGGRYTSNNSSVDIEFPYIPKTKYVDASLDVGK